MNNEIAKLIEDSTVLDVKTKRIHPIPKPRSRRVVQPEALALIEQEVAKASRAREPLDTKIEAFGLFEKAAGGRDELKHVLTHCPEESQAVKHVRHLLEDKDFLLPSHYTLSALCTRHKIPLNVVLTGFRDAKMAQMTVESLITLAGGVPKVVEQLAVDATNRFDECNVCEGKKRVRKIGDNGEWMLEDGQAITQLCYNCRGTGKVYKEHDFQNRKTMLEITGILTSKGQGSSTTVNVDNRKAIISGDFQPGDGSFERLVQAVDIINVRPVEDRIIDVEVPFSDYEVDALNPVLAAEPVRE